MKLSETIGFFTLAFSVWMLFFSLVFATDTNAMEGTFISIPGNLVSTCVAKVEVTGFTYEHVDKIDEEMTLQVLERDWNSDWSKDPEIKYASYVDMQRIVRDAYRKKEAGQITPDTLTQQTDTEMIACIENGF